MRNSLSKTVVIDSPAELRQLLDNMKIDVDAIDELTEECLLVRYTPLNEWVEENDW